MPRSRNAVPVYRHHKPTGQAICTVRLANGSRKDLYLGKHGTAASRVEFNRILALVAANNGTYPTIDPDVTLSELLLAYYRFADGYYRDPEGKKSATVERLKQSLRVLRKLYGRTPAVQFGPKALKAVRETWVQEGLSRKVVNSRVGNVKRIYRWAVGEELIPPSAFEALAAVEGLRAGRTSAPDREPVKPAVLADVETIFPFLSETVRALVIVQLHSGARAGELVKLRVGDIDRTDPNAWTFRPVTHKGTWRGKGRVIYFGARCREALAPLILKAGGPDAYVFSPARAEAERIAERSANRKTPRFPSHMKRNEMKRVGAKRKRMPHERYTTGTYRRAIERACEAAGVPTFTPHRLRHLAATRVRAELGVDAARALLGHSLASITEIYSHEVDKQLALKAVAAFG